MRLKLGKCGNGHFNVLDGDHVALFNQKIPHHPVGHVAAALLGHELEHAAMSGSTFDVGQLEEHGILDVKSG